MDSPVPYGIQLLSTRLAFQVRLLSIQVLFSYPTQQFPPTHTFSTYYPPNHMHRPQAGQTLTPFPPSPTIIPQHAYTHTIVTVIPVGSTPKCLMPSIIAIHARGLAGAKP